MLEIRKIAETDYPNGKKFPFTYESDFYYDVHIKQIAGNWQISLELKSFEKTFYKEMEVDIFQDYKPELECYSVLLNSKEIGMVAFNHEKWNNVVRIWDLYLNPANQGKGIGKKVMDLVKERAIQLQVRAIVLETQTSNYNAIRFYLKNGFSLIGLDTINYTNQDIKNKEVRIEMGYLLA
jgi:ribosomal protein S18 acetylase RimI-like enzyme